MIRFFQRLYPSANSVLLTGSQPVLVDTGFGSDAAQLLAWLEQQSAPPCALALIVNTHFHSDHVGGNHALQSRFGIPAAASAPEAALINRRDPDACDALWLRQPVQAYEVGRVLAAGEEIATGDGVWTVVATPGHTAGHVSLHCRAAGAIVLGDALHNADVGWLSPCRDGAEALERTAETIERLAALPARIGYSGHGPAITDLQAALARARRRVENWRERPEQVAWHACKRIFAHALMLHDGLAEPELEPALLACPWFCDHATLAFGLSPRDFLPLLVDEMLRADAAYWAGGKLTARAAYRAPRPGWLTSPGKPAAWPAATPLLPA